MVAFIMDSIMKVLQKLLTLQKVLGFYPSFYVLKGIKSQRVGMRFDISIFRPLFTVSLSIYIWKGTKTRQVGCGGSLRDEQASGWGGGVILNLREEPLPLGKSSDQLHFVTRLLKISSGNVSIVQS